MNHTDSNEQQGEALETAGANGHIHKFGIVNVPPEFGHSYRRCAECLLSIHLAGHDPIHCELCARSPAVSAALGDEGRLFEAKLLGFEDDWRIRLCETCVRRATEDNFVVHACALPLAAAPTSSPAAQPDGDSLALSAKLARVAQRFNNATTHDEVAALVWAGRALIDADAEQAPFFTVEYQDKTLVYRAVLGLYFEHAKRVLGREPYPVEVDQIETGFCNPWLEAKKPERMERGRQLLVEILADQSPAAAAEGEQEK